MALPTLRKQMKMTDSSPIKRGTSYDHSEDKIVQHSVQDISPLLELNKKEFNKDYIHGGVETQGGMRKVASIPLIIIENPTWGIDVGSIAFIHQKILDIKAKGAAILLVSNELDEIEVLADSAVVMYEGNISKRITKDIKFRENIATKMLSGVHIS